MEITYVNRGLRIEYGSNPRSYEHYLSSGENEAFFSLLRTFVFTMRSFA